MSASVAPNPIFKMFKELYIRRCNNGKKITDKHFKFISTIMTSKICHARVGELIKSSNDSKGEQRNLRDDAKLLQKHITKADIALKI
jgi:hypothetical protein